MTGPPQLPVARADRTGRHTSNGLVLAPESVAAIARQVVELLLDADPAPLVDAQTLAVRLGVTRATVYAHADLLGARRVGEGARPRLRFDVAQATTAWTSRSPNERSQTVDSPASAGDARRRRAPRRASSARRVPERTASGAPLLDFERRKPDAAV